MAESWGNLDPNTGEPTVYNQDLISDENNKNILKVNDVNDDNDAKKAAHFVNGSTDIDSRGLKVEGIAEFTGRSGNAELLMLKDCQILHTDNGDGLQIKPGSGNDSVYISPGQYVLIVSGELQATDARVTNDLNVGGDQNVQGQFEVVGKILVGDNDGGRIDAFATDPNQRDLKLGTESNNTRDVLISQAGQTTKVQGELEVQGHGMVIEGDDGDQEATIDSGTNNYDLKIGTNGDNNNLFLGRSNCPTHIQGIGIVRGQLGVGASDGNGLIDANGSPNAQDLKIGTGASTDDVIIAKQDKMTIIDCNLRVGRTEIDMVHASRIDAYGNGGNPDTLFIGSQAHTTAVGLGRNGQLTRVLGRLSVDEEGAVGGDLSVGPTDDAGHIDSGGDDLSPQDLEIGTQDGTSDVIIGRNGQQARFDGALAVMQAVQVGPSDSAGQIDSGGSALSPQDLKVGTDSVSSNLILGRSGKKVDIKGDARMNGAELIMDSSSGLSSGCGFVYNATGSGTAGESIDVYIGGTKVGYWDANGWH